VVNLLTFKHIGSMWTATIPVRMSLSILKVMWRVMAWLSLLAVGMK